MWVYTRANMCSDSRRLLMTRFCLSKALQHVQ
jgi:hypothetical protein